MSKRTKTGAIGCSRAKNNPVAKHARKFNKAAVFRDRTLYARRPKHRGLEPFPIYAAAGVRVSEKASGDWTVFHGVIAWPC